MTVAASTAPAQPRSPEGRSHQARLPGLDALRALAVIVVIFYHLTIFGELPISILSVSYFGWMGVDLFFVLSGFLIGQQLFQGYFRGDSPSILGFYQRRAWRILPAYLAIVALYFFVPSWREFHGDAPAAMAPLWKFLTFTMNFGFSFDQRAFSHAWSLCVEEHFYLILPVITALYMRRPSRLRTILTIALIVTGGVALRWWLLAQSSDDIWSRIYYPTYTRLDGLVAGVSLALIVVFRPEWWQRLKRHGHTLLLAGAICVAAMIWMTRGHDLGSDSGSARWALIIGFPLLSLGLALITASAISANGLLAKLRIPGAQTVATLAFALYLTHKAVAHLVMIHLPQITEAQGPLSWLLYAASCLAAALVLHFAIERPFLAIRDRHKGQERARAIEKEIETDPAI